MAMHFRTILRRIVLSSVFQIMLGAALFVGVVYIYFSRIADTNYMYELSSRANNIYAYEYYNDFLTDKKVIIIPSGCWTVSADAYTDPVSMDPINGEQARLDQVLNEINHNVYGSDISFYQFGFPDPNFDTGLKNIYSALRQPNVRAILYINAPGGLEAFIDPHGLVGLKETLNKIKQDYPSLTKDATFFSDKATNSIGFKEDYSNESGYKLKSYLPILGQLKSEIAAPSLFIKRLKTSPMKDQLPSITPTARKANNEYFHQEFLKTVALARANYDNVRAYGLPLRQMMPANLFWRADGGVFESFIRMAAGMAQQKGVVFVYYIPPHLNVTDEEYEHEFKPVFVDRVAAILRKFPNAYLINHSRIDGFSTYDLAHIKHEVHKPRRVVNSLESFKPFTANYAPGYVFNMIGKIKQARNLLADLDGIGGIKLSNGDPRVPTEFEEGLKNPQDTRQAFLPCRQYQALYETILDDDRYRRSLPVGSIEPQLLNFNELCKPY